jgi:hypothetical protein
MVPLGTSSYQVFVDSVVQARATAMAQGWLQGSEYRVVTVTLVEDAVRIVVTGQGPMPDAAELEAGHEGELYGRDLVLEIVPQQRVLIPGR